MPVYDISCKKCGLREEHAFLSYKDFDVYICPQCGTKEWIKHPCKTNWCFGKHSIQKDSASEVAEMGYGKPT